MVDGLAQAPALSNVPPADIGTPPTLDPSTVITQPATAEGFIIGLVTQYPWLATVLLVIGSLRLVFKPVMLGIEWYTKQTPNPNDDVAVLKFEASPLYKVLSIGLDVIGSVKLPAIKPPTKK